jgi:hypothetical protein
MAPPSNIRLGPLSRSIATGARWLKEDEYPAWQKYADELERLAAFANREGQFSNYLPRLQGRKSERDSALAELRVAFHFDANAFKITEWKPVGAGATEGEFTVAGPSGSATFVEVKSPGWEGELSEEEKRGGRARLPKYLHLEGRFVAPWERIQFAVEKSYKKLAATRPNLLVIADDLFASPRHGTETHVDQALYDARSNGCFAGPKFQNLGGVGIFWEEDASAYHMKLFLNRFALPPTSLPDDMQARFDGHSP